MKYVKMLGLAAVSAMALMAFFGASSASATVLCTTPNETDHCAPGWDLAVGSVVKATQSTGTTAVLETTGGVVLDTCTGSEISATISGTGGASATTVGTLNPINWGTCSRTTDTLKIGNLEVHHIAGTDNGTLTATNTEVTINTIFGTCVFGTGGVLDVGKLTGGTPAVIHTEKAVVPKISGNAACPPHGVWNATFQVTNHHELYVSAT